MVVVVVVVVAMVLLGIAGVDTDNGAAVAWEDGDGKRLRKRGASSNSRVEVS